MANKDIARKLQQELLKQIDSIANSVKHKDILDPIGAGMVDEMREMISKGLSPIEGAGRFPEYKSKARAKSLRKTAKAISKEADQYQGDSRYSRRARRQVSNKASAIRKTAKQTENRGYPNSVKKKFPNKRARPVNLFLSGKFLSDLKEFVVGASDNAKLFVGFQDFQSELKEQGHREGQNTQAKRPIIPSGSERFAQRIQRVAERILGIELAKKLKRQGR